MRDTSSLTYSERSFPYTGWCSRQPDEFFPYSNPGGGVADHFFMTAASEFNGHQLRGSGMAGFFRNPQNCWKPGLDPSSSTYRYADGLGLVEHRSADPGSPHPYSENLVWFQKGAETWGSRVATGCSSLLGSEEILRKSGLVVKITPSPVKTEAVISIESVKPFKRCEFLLFDLNGKEILNQALNSNKTTINRRNIPGGFYTWKVLTPIGTASGKVIFD